MYSNVGGKQAYRETHCYSDNGHAAFAAITTSFGYSANTEMNNLKWKCMTNQRAGQLRVL